jgi:hypothetical protein
MTLEDWKRETTDTLLEEAANTGKVQIRSHTDPESSQWTVTLDDGDHDVIWEQGDDLHDVLAMVNHRVGLAR